MSWRGQRGSRGRDQITDRLISMMPASGISIEHLEAGFAEALSSIAIPVVSVLGAQSPLPVRQGERTAALIPGAEVRIIQAAGHLPWFEQPGCVAAALARVSESLPRTS